ncbi:MAG TPA: branched-chain amino acid transaminase [Candidatus Baltobacteraceae bacterium]
MSEYVWFDGVVRDADDVRIRPFTHALHYGTAVFEGIRAYDVDGAPAVFRLRDHLERLYRSAQVYGLEPRPSLDELGDAIFATLAANGYDDGYIRPLVFFGEKGISLTPRLFCPTHVLIALRPLRGSLIGNDPDGCRVTISPWRKTPSISMPSTVKGSGHYVNSVLALQEAQGRGFDEAILLNDRGDVAEGTGENVFVVKNGVVRTNDSSADVLNGITRLTAIELARDLGIPVEIGDLTVEQLLTADEAFFTGTAAEIMPIAAIDDVALPDHKPIATRLRAAYTRATCGQDRAHRAWLTVKTPTAAIA